MPLPHVALWVWQSVAWGETASLWQRADLSFAYTPHLGRGAAKHVLVQQPKPQLGRCSCRGHRPTDSSTALPEAGFGALDSRTPHALKPSGVAVLGSQPPPTQSGPPKGLP